MNSLNKRIFCFFLFSFALKGFSQNLSTVKIIDSRYQSCLDKGKNMYGCSQYYYFQMDSMLNVVYKKIRNKMDSTQKTILKEEQLKWLKNRDKHYKEIDAEPKEEGISPEDNKMVLIDKKAEYIEDRVVYLIKKYISNK